MSKSKKLTQGVPIVDSNGAVTPVTISELAKQVGKELGVQRVSYDVKGSGWVRLARIDSNAVILLISNVYESTRSRGTVLSVTGSYNTMIDAKANVVAGNIALFDKVRFVGKGQELYFEVHSSIEETKSNKWFISAVSTVGKETRVSVELYETNTPGEVPEGFTVKELTVAEIGGGVNVTHSVCYALKLKGGLQHEQGEETGRNTNSRDSFFFLWRNICSKNGEIVSRKNDDASSFRIGYERGCGDRTLSYYRHNGKCSGIRKWSIDGDSLFFCLSDTDILSEWKSTSIYTHQDKFHFLRLETTGIGIARKEVVAA